jgi:hypothetical protein
MAMYGSWRKLNAPCSWTRHQLARACSSVVMLQVAPSAEMTCPPGEHHRDVNDVVLGRHLHLVLAVLVEHRDALQRRARGRARP